jgi:hypothetical protein
MWIESEKCWFEVHTSQPLEHGIPTITVCQVLHKRLRFKLYKLPLFQTLSEEDKVRTAAFCENFVTLLEGAETYDLYFISHDEVTFHLHGIINK